MSQTKVSSIIFSSLVCGCLMHSLLGAAESRRGAETEPVPTVQANRLNIRQIEGGGIGYGQGYTTLETFLTPYYTFDSWLPFVDLRVHHFDNNKYAFNTGLGFRYFTPSNCTIWGVNAYYDYRQASHKNFKQIGIGLEALGAHWDYRINGYIPVGDRTSKFYHPKFDKFKGHNLYIQRKREFDMAGVNAEAAYHWMPKDTIDITAALGPYYFQGKYNQFAAGGQARVKATFLNAISLEGITSYDNLFKWKGQGQLTFSIPLGPKLKTCGIKRSSCCDRPALDLRVVEPVQRFEIIVADTHRQSKIAIDPATGLPYFFVFVDNDPPTSPDGSFEHPFLTLADAQNGSASGDIIYVYAGDLYMVATPGFMMQDSQKLWGSGISHPLSTSVGKVSVPVMTANYPAFSNGAAAAFSMINLANNNEVSGLYFPSVDTMYVSDPAFAAISVVGVTNALVENNIINLNGVSGMSPTGIVVGSCGGTITLNNNTVTVSDQTSGTSGYPLYLYHNVDSPCSYVLTNNTVVGNNNLIGFDPAIYLYFLDVNTTSLNMSIQNNTFIQCNNGFYMEEGNCQFLSFQMTNNTISYAAIEFQTGAVEFSITNNTFQNSRGDGVDLYSISGATSRGQFNNNVFQGNAANSLYAETDSVSSLCLQLNGNSFDQPPYMLGNPPNGPLYLEIPLVNTGAQFTFSDVTFVNQGTCE